ncbi:unnamed protein product [Sphenostylis stenocarpa]|uniref:Uncharacterized protein n=1 Tax=Sphenostylis stenocarpa TaxID=92480 RepID=A0AA86SQB1_9FABA|nr:unnamed protein product [Sphenostylis stenocarpa]
MVKLASVKLQLQLQVLLPLIFQCDPQPRNLLVLFTMIEQQQLLDDHSPLLLVSFSPKLHFQQLLFQAPFQHIRVANIFSFFTPPPPAMLAAACTTTNINMIPHLLGTRFPSKRNLFCHRIIVWEHRIKLQPVLVEVPPADPSLLHRAWRGLLHHHHHHAPPHPHAH